MGGVVVTVGRVSRTPNKERPLILAPATARRMGHLVFNSPNRSDPDRGTYVLLYKASHPIRTLWKEMTRTCTVLGHEFTAHSAKSLRSLRRGGRAKIIS